MARRRQDTTSDSTQTSAKTASRTGRRAAPVPTIIRLHLDLEPNENHPLVGLDPARREEERRQLFATILARIANGPAMSEDKQRTMEETKPSSGEGDDESDRTKR